MTRPAPQQSIEAVLVARAELDETEILRRDLAAALSVVTKLRDKVDSLEAELELATTAEQACADVIEQNVHMVAVLGQWVQDKAVVDWRAIDSLLGDLD